jgi:hypothetical protein
MKIKCKLIEDEKTKLDEANKKLVEELMKAK